MDDNYINEAFTEFRVYMDEEENIREELRAIVKELDQDSRDIMTILQNVHKHGGLLKISEICGRAREKYVPVKEHFAKLSDAVPDFYKYNDHWRFVSQKLIFSAAFIVFLETGRLIDRHTAADFLGISANQNDRFHIELDDYLLGCLLLADELTRLSLNSAAFAEYKRPVQIADFVSDIHSGFRLLNLKNDTLRKKFDALKYNLKKVEEVVYDLSIRGLIKADDENELN